MKNSFFLISILIIVGCVEKSSLYKKSAKGSETSISIAYKDIPKLVYGPNLEPFEILIRDHYGNQVFDSKMPIEHTVIREWFQNIKGVGIDLEMLESFSDDSIRVLFHQLYSPLFPKGKKGDKPLGYNNLSYLEDTLKIDFSQEINKSNTRAIVKEKNCKYFMRKVEGCWKIYKYDCV